MVLTIYYEILTVPYGVHVNAIHYAYMYASNKQPGFMSTRVFLFYMQQMTKKKKTKTKKQMTYIDIN